MLEVVHPSVAMLEGRGQERVGKGGKGSGDPMVPTLRNFVALVSVFRRYSSDRRRSLHLHFTAPHSHTIYTDNE
jgi:hypothetical protein